MARCVSGHELISSYTTGGSLLPASYGSTDLYDTSQSQSSIALANNPQTPSGTATYQYNPAGQLTSDTPPAGSATTFTYNTSVHG